MLCLCRDSCDYSFRINQLKFLEEPIILLTSVRPAMLPGRGGSAAGGGVKRYGLQPLPLSKRASTVKAFQMNDDDDETTESTSAQPAQYASIRAKKLAKEAAAVLAEDPHAFDYDDVYEEEIASKKPQQAAPAARLGLGGGSAAPSTSSTAPTPAPAAPSRYISSLLAKSAQRKLEQETIYERNLLRERAKEDELYGDKEKFVTGAYRQQLEEQERLRKQLEEQDRRDEAAERVRMSGGMGAAGLGMSAAKAMLSSRAGEAAEPQSAPSATPTSTSLPTTSISAATTVAPQQSDRAVVAPSQMTRSPLLPHRARAPPSDAAAPTEPSASMRTSTHLNSAHTTSAPPPSSSSSPILLSKPMPMATGQTALVTVAARLLAPRDTNTKAEEARARYLERKKLKQQ